MQSDIPTSFRRSTTAETATHAICDCGTIVKADASSHPCRWRYLVRVITTEMILAALSNHTGVGGWASIRPRLPNKQRPVLVILGGLGLSKTAPQRLENPGPGRALR